MESFFSSYAGDDKLLATESEKLDIRHALKQVFNDEARATVSSWYVRNFGKLEVPFETQQEQRAELAQAVLVATGLDMYGIRAKVMSSRANLNFGGVHLSPNITASVCVENREGVILFSAEVDVTTGSISVKHFNFDEYSQIRSRRNPTAGIGHTLQAVRVMDRAVAWYVLAITLGSFFLTVKQFWL